MVEQTQVYYLVKFNMIKLLKLSLLFVFIYIGFCFVYSIKYKSYIIQNEEFVIESGDSINKIALNLKQRHFISNIHLFKLIVYLMGNKAQKGLYEFTKGNTLIDIAKKITEGKVAFIKIVIPEGYTNKQIFNLLNSNNKLNGVISCELKKCDVKEGDLFPDTYFFIYGESRDNVILSMKHKMNMIKQEYINIDIPKPLKNFEEVLILASIVQKETAKIQEMPIIASVYLNRLNIKMKLQADPTVVYAITNGLGDMKEKKLYRDYFKINSPYNTYKYKGLPINPIANMGRKAIESVLKPADTTFLYFVADGTGGHVFETSYEKHKSNHEKWRQIRN